MTSPNEALRTILPIAGWGDTEAADVIFTRGADPVLPTPFHIGAAGGATPPANRNPGREVWGGFSAGGSRGSAALSPAHAALGQRRQPSAPRPAHILPAK